jgi:ammonia channel protein AmtB
MKGKASMLGAASVRVAGLVAITPACGNVGLWAPSSSASSPASPACGASTA